MHMIVRKYLWSLFAVLMLSGGAQAAQYNAPEVDRMGTIQSIDLATNSMVVEGHRYFVGQAAQVEIAGSFGAFTMLNTGMRIAFKYLRYDDGRREIFSVRELLSSEFMEQA
jgi:hypothetical protein